MSHSITNINIKFFRLLNDPQIIVMNLIGAGGRGGALRLTKRNGELETADS